MNNFEFYNPTRIIFGAESISKIKKLIPRKARVLLLYGGGSIKKNGVYMQVADALRKHELFEFGGIEPNPDYATLMKAVKLVRKNKIDFLLAVGGGSVIDGAKFIADPPTTLQYANIVSVTLCLIKISDCYAQKESYFHTVDRQRLEPHGSEDA